MANSDCKNVLNLIPLYIDNMLSDQETDMIYRHLDSCESCKKEFEIMNSLMGKTKNLPQVDVPTDFHKNLMTKVEPLARAKKAKRYLALRRLGTGVAVAAVIALSVVAFNNLSTPQNSTDPDRYIKSSPDVSENPTNKIVPESKQSTIYENEISSDITDVQTLKPEMVLEKDFSSGGGSSAVPKTDEILEIKLDDESQSYTIATITVPDESLGEVLELLSSYEKDDKGYIIPDIKPILRKLAESGITVDAVTSDTITKNYIIIK